MVLRRSSWLLLGAVAATGWTIVLLVLVAVRTSGAGQVLGGLGVVVSIAISAYAALYTPKDRLPIPDWAKPHVAVGASYVVVAVLVVDFFTSASWFGWSYYQAHQSIDALAQIKLSHQMNMPPGTTASLDLDPIKAKRRNLMVTFVVKDPNPNIGNCVPTTKLTVVANNRGNNQPVKDGVRSGEAVPVPLAPGLSKLHLEITVTNEDDRNCLVNIGVSRALLTN